MKFTAWKTYLKVEREFRKSLYYLTSLFEKISKETKGNLNAYQEAMDKFQNSIQYKNYINSIIKKMVTPLAVENQKTWREAAKRANRSSYIYKLLMEELNNGLEQVINSQISQNANLIKTLPNDVANKVTRDISKLTFSGLIASEIEKIIKDKTNQHSKASARLIARTEVAKTQSALTQARAENLGLDWYVWRTALDGDRVRKSHRNMEGVLVNWNNPPSPEELVGEKYVGNYHAGNIWNCRCYSEPLLELKDVKWPHKVYYNNKIINMTQEQFVKYNNL